MMSALYDSGLFDSDDMAEAYADGYNAAKHTMMLTITTFCPICMEPLAVAKHPLWSLSLVVDADLRWCIKCETEVPAMIRLST
jgi:hypothetical protein